ncbi:MAG: sulfatase-like hydrolase/transferase [Lachnospiraceae bacterium]|nr:sulfatase-like hydrolase/transferase [Lachnospiraceae bacterium]
MIALLFKRRVFVYLIVSAFWIVLGCVNMGLLSKRVTPFNATDIFMIKTGLRIADKYIKPITFVTYGVIAVLGIAFLIFVWKKGPKIQGTIRRVRNAIVLVCMIVVTVIAISISLDTGFIANSFNNLPNAYKAYGFTYCFLNSIFDNGVDKPENYSNEEIIELVDESEHGEIEITKVTDATPNIIMIQLESFFDITRMDNLEFSVDPIPYFRSLKENYNGGYIDVPSIGAGTSNTEFEVLTGMNLEDFGSGEIPYKGVLLKETCESMAYDLGKNGYTAHAIHNNDATFYQRHTVYPNLGFDTFTSMEYMQLKDSDYTPIKWVRDEILTSCINDCLNSTEDGTDFVFTVSVEGHGSYPNYYVSGMNNVIVTSADTKETSYATQYYTNLIHDMDGFIEGLVTSLNERNEPTILVLYGDHLPSLGLEQEHMKDGTLTQTEYVIWNNMGLSFDFGNLQTYQLMPRLLGALGIEDGVINSYHQTHINDEEDEYLSGLQNLEYDLLYGGKAAFDGENPYKTKNMKFGIKDIVITDVYKTIEDEKTYLYVKGDNITKWSMINVNGDYYKTEMIDFGLVRCEYSALPMDEIFLAQVGKDKYQLSKSEAFIYQ